LGKQGCCKTFGGRNPRQQAEMLRWRQEEDPQQQAQMLRWLQQVDPQ